ncbi:hypothetical protein [Nocardioides pyridinolyticus]
MSEPGGFDRYGGDLRYPREATGFFRTEKSDDGWRLVTPEGHPFFIVGIAHVDDSVLKYAESIDVYRQRYGSRATGSPTASWRRCATGGSTPWPGPSSG